MSCCDKIPINTNLVGKHITFRDEWTVADYDDIADGLLSEKDVNRMKCTHSGQVIAAWADRNNHFWVALNDGRSHNLQEHEVLKIDGID